MRQGCVHVQQSQDTGDLPLDWRQANISPIYKKGATTSPANYRPVSLTSNCCKLLEHIIDSQIMRHLSKHKILADHQHAFRKARSCESQLILTAHDLSLNLDNKTTTDIAVLDFSKAFDVMPHERLLLKLDFYGIRNKPLKWIRSFLTKSYGKWRVIRLEACPQRCPTRNGVRTSLFRILINDIHENVKSCTRLFADDCLVYNTVNSPEDELQLQKDLDQMVEWSHKWGMKFNPAKCNTMRVTRDRNPQATQYKMLDTTLEETNHTKYRYLHPKRSPMESPN